MGCYKWYESRPSRFHRRVWLGVQVYGALRMWAQCGHMAWHMTTLDTQTWLRGEDSWIGVDRRERRLLRRVDCDILAPEMVISWLKP
jgi:hypothetical protein